MRKPILFLIPIFIFLQYACNPAPSDKAPDDEQVIEKSAADSVQTSTDLTCRPGGTFIEGNRLVIREQNRAVFIVADSTTDDEQFGASHRVLVVMDLENCQEVDRKVLPVNESPDVPYLLADVSYHRVRQIIAIKGLKVVLGYDLRQQEVLGPMEPEFLNEREYADAQSGNIQRLEVWEDYLVGYATDLGAFAFALDDEQGMRPYLPVAEHQMNGLAHRSVFLMPTRGDEVQAILPLMNMASGEFRVHALLDQPSALTGKPQSLPIPNVFLGRIQEEAVVVDLQALGRVELPDELKKAGMEQIEEWLASNQ